MKYTILKAKEKTLVFILTKEEKEGMVCRTYNFVGNESLKKEMENYFLEQVLNKNKYGKI